MTSCSRPTLASFFLNNTPTTEISPLSLPDPLPISAQRISPTTAAAAVATAMAGKPRMSRVATDARFSEADGASRSEEHTSELQSRQYLVCRLLLEKKNNSTENRKRHATATERTHDG